MTLPRFALSVFLHLLMLCSASTTSLTPVTCRGASAKYEVTFYNFLTSNLFGSLIPPDGLVFSPLTAVSHSNRVSLLTVRGFAGDPIKQIAEAGNNGPLLDVARSLRGKGTKTVVGAKGPTMPGNSTMVKLMVDCKNPFITVLGMIAPSPDWFVQLSNYNLFNSRYGSFVPNASGYLIAYDAGTDSGSDFTNPADKSLDMPTSPPMNIAPLLEDGTDPFERHIVGKYYIKKVSN